MASRLRDSEAVLATVRLQIPLVDEGLLRPPFLPAADRRRRLFAAKGCGRHFEIVSAAILSRHRALCLPLPFFTRVASGAVDRGLSSSARLALL